METGEKATSHGKAPSRESGAKGKEESPLRVKSHQSGDKKKNKMKKVVYYETDSSSPSTSGSDTESVTSKRHERKKYSKMPLCYPRISKRTPLLYIPLGKPPCFDGEDYCMWSDKMRHHLTSLHARIWDIVEFGAQVPNVGDKDYDSNEVAQIRHFNSQATTILLVSLCREEYNKVQGLKSAKEIWDVLKTAHEGDEVTKSPSGRRSRGSSVDSSSTKERSHKLCTTGSRPWSIKCATSGAPSGMTMCWNLLSVARRPTRMNSGDNRDTCSGANSSVNV
jgi:hypothetical protein